MPTKPRNDPPPELRRALTERSTGHCESCGLAHHARGARDEARAWHPEAELEGYSRDRQRQLFGARPPQLIRIVLTVRRKPQAPDDHDPQHYEHLCQHCYHVRDRDLNVARRQQTMHESRVKATLDAGQPPLFGPRREP